MNFTTKRHMPIAFKVFLVCAGVALSASMLGSAILYEGAIESLKEEIRTQLKAVAATAAVQVDPALHSRIQTRADERSPEYKHIKSVLASIRDANPGIRRVYTMRKTHNVNTLQFVVDAEEKHDDRSHVGDLYDISAFSELRSGFRKPSADEEPVTDAWGAWLSGYAPIKDKNGSVEAVLGVDMSMAQFHAQQIMLKKAALRNLLVVFLCSVLLSMLVTKALLRPVHVLSNAANRVQNGDLDFRIPRTSSDEVGRLMSNFNSMVAGLKANRDHLIELSNRDYLTGLYNHAYLHERLEEEVVRAEQAGLPLSLLRIDIDWFKNINNTFGHSCGDSMLCRLAEVVRNRVRRMDVVARYGGDELAVILPDTEISAALEMAEQLRKSVESEVSCIPTQDSEGTPGDGQQSRRSVGLTITIGIAAYPEHHTTKDGLLMAADIALSSAKHTSRNSIKSYDPDLAGTDGLDLDDVYQVLRDPNLAAIRSLMAAVDAKDHYTLGHCERVVDHVLRMGKSVGLNAEQMEVLRVAGLLHDLGKIGVPDSILNKNGRLTPEEREMIEKHPSVGANILQRAPQLTQIIPAILFHHENYDGSGYPDGLAGEDIPLFARILAIADAFDAMTSDRPYRNALPVEVALTELQYCAGKQFDPNLVQVFLSILPEDLRKAA